MWQYPPCALYEASYHVPAASYDAQLERAINLCLWGTEFATRSGTAIRTLTLKAHVADPQSAIHYRTLNLFMDKTKTVPLLDMRCQRLMLRYEQDWNFATMGPVGNLLRSSQSLGLRWDNTLCKVTTLADGPTDEEPVTDLVSMCKGERHHFVRARPSTLAASTS